MIDLKEIRQKLIQGMAPEVKELVQKAIDEGQDVGSILNDGLLAGMSVVGERFKKAEVFFPEVLVAANAMKAGMESLKPLLAEKNIGYSGKAVLGTVRGDLHDIGKNLVGMMLEGAGFEVIDLGVDVSPERFVETVKGENADIIGMSSLITTTMPMMKRVIESLSTALIRERVKVMVGGAPITQQYADEIGADGFAPDAATAVDKAKELMGSR
ncbi:MAG: corrinoid protein [Deltaproteobacteria bacterium]|nr:MAG: corrinoid protein [Deltaproteobacteria bacterium]